MTGAFGDDGLSFAEDPRLNGGEWPPPVARPEPVRPAPAVNPEPTPDAPPEQVPTGWVDRKLAGQLWYSLPQPAYPDLVRDAREGDWTLSNAARCGRLAWLWLPAIAARIGAWSILRLWAGKTAPRIGGEQPPIRELIAKARESGRRDKALCALYIPARVVSHIADYAGRTIIALVLAWLTANALNGIPGVEVLVPDVISPARWWTHITTLSPDISAPNPGPVEQASPETATPETGNPIAETVFIIAALIVGGLIYLRHKTKRRGREIP